MGCFAVGTDSCRLEFRVWGLGLGLGFRVSGLGFSGLRIEGLGLRLRAWGLGLRCCIEVKFTAEDLRFRIEL